MNTRFNLIFISCLITVLILATTRYYFVRHVSPSHISHIFGDQRVLATVKGTIISPIRTDTPGQGIASIPWLNHQSSFYIEATSLKTHNGWQRIYGKIRVQAGEPIRHIQPGNKVEIYCWLSRFESPPNPGQFDLKKHMHQRGVYVAAHLPIAESIEVINPSRSIFSKIRSCLFHITSDRLIDETLIDKDVRSLASALLLGRRDSLSPQLMAAFRDTNLAHFISLSGMHVGILAGSLWLVLRTAGLSKRPRAVICIILLIIYALVVPPRAPTLRAVLLSCFFFGSVFLRRQTNPLNTLALSAIVLLFIRPYELFTAGWQLSFMSVLGIIVFFPAMRYHLLGKFFYPIVSYLPQSFRILESILYTICELLAVGLSVWITIAPILLYYFGRINPLSCLWTLIVLPFVTVLLYTGFLKILFSSLFPTLATISGWLFNRVALGFENLVMALSKIDIVQITSYRPSLLLVFVIYVLILTYCMVPGWFYKFRKTVFALILLCFIFPGVMGHLKRNNNDCLELTFLSVGHGQCCILSGPDNQHLLFDAGSITHKLIASKTILPFLQHQNIFSLDAIGISHGDLDHINAITDIVAGIKVHQIYVNQKLLDHAKEPSLEQEFCKQLNTMDQIIKSFREFKQSDRFTIKSIWPITETLIDQTISENDKSEVILLEYANRKILLCGDIEHYAQNQIMQLLPDIQINVLVLPHHGSTNNLSQSFVESFNPSVLIASCSRRTVRNAYHPSSDSTTQAFYTATDGAVTVKIKADGTLSITGFRNSSVY